MTVAPAVRLAVRLARALPLLGFAALLAACPPKLDKGKCENDKDCEQWGGGVCVQGNCQECRTNGDCKAGQECRANRCEQPPECRTDADCPSPKLCREEKCVFECEKDADCAPGSTCVENRCKQQAQPQPGDTAGGACELQPVYFGFDDYNIDERARPILEANAACLKQKAELSLNIEGHADERGTSEYNYALGERRAHSVKKLLQNLGVDAARLQVVSYGEDRPADKGGDESAWARNRRAELVPR